MYSSSTGHRFVQVDDTPLWVRVGAIDAITALRSRYRPETIIHLSSGDHVTTDVSVDDVMVLLRRASQ